MKSNIQILLAMLLSIGFLICGDTHAAPKPTTKPLPFVVIVKQDNSTLRGQITAIGPYQLTVQPAPKPTQPANTVLDPVMVPWTQIKSISSGLTRAKAVQQWKIEHTGQLCETCHGEGTMFCSVCKGTGKDPAAVKDCKTCGGELLVDCTGPKCDKGKIPCPMPCLKLSEGPWVVHKDDGLRWKSFHLGTATVSYSEHHLGDIIQIDLKNHTANDIGKCPLCGGVGTVDCPICHGTGKMPCPTCTARKDVAACPNNCDHGLVVCPDCAGSGLKKGA